MSEGDGVPPAPDPRALALDWITIWQSELSALASDQELQDSWIRLVTQWAQFAARAAHMLPPGLHDSAPGRTGPQPPARTATALAPSDPRDAAIEQLARRVAELERRLAAHESGSTAR
jgi:uncharacterized protein YceH (UPF0502 family)